MKKKVLNIAMLFFNLIILFTLFCGDDPYNPLDMTDPRYQPMELDITADIPLTNDTLSISTDSVLVLGVESKHLDRIDSVRIDYDVNKITDQPVIIKRSDLEITSGETKIKLNSSGTFSQPGVYVVEVYAYTINGDNVSSLITVIVGGVAPRITRNPANSVSAETDTARFSVKAEGTKPLYYFWYFSADTSKEGALLNPLDTLDSTFVDDFVELSDSGFYYCIVKNDFGSITSRYVQLKVSPQVLPADAPSVFFEKDSSAGEESVNAVLTLKLSAPYDKEVLVHVSALTSSQANETDDYTFKNSTVLIPAHTTSANLLIDINDDVIGEGSEILALQINSSRNARVGDHAKHYYTIYDDDVADSTWPELYFSSAAGSGVEGQNASIEVGLGLKSLNWQYVVSVKCRVSTSSTASPEDYILVDSVITFNINETSRRISLQTIKDKISENDEVVKIELALPGKAVLSSSRPTVYTFTIQDGDLCAIYFKEMEIKGLEGDTTNLNDSIMVNLTTPSVNEVTVKYEIVQDISSAVNQGTDYLLPGEGFVRFAPGVQVAWIPVVITGDTIKEGEEIFGLKLSNPTGGAVIQNSDPFKFIIADNETVTLSFKSSETAIDENIGDISVTVSLSKLASDTIRVDYKVVGNAQGGLLKAEKPRH
ncbi:MAG TPA: immunoglobulin domain-containing protein [Chitinispirillaceae bacterium]|nr:immunoglobulin domain-containing protein [Chitinispirillaceae bacterium]